MVPAALFATGAAAQLTISTATTTPVTTSTAASGSPADITVSSTGSITLNGGAAITADSNNAVSNAGTLTQGAANGATGIAVTSGTSGAISNTGTISITETFTAPNPDANSTVDGAIAQASDRAGIRIAGGGTHAGDILQGGTVTIEGLDSAGVRIGDAVAGSVRTSGATAVRGDNSVGVQTGAVSGDIVIAGATTVVGRGAIAVDITGDVGGTVRFANSVGQQLSFTDDSAATVSLGRADLRVGAPAVRIAGNVGAGIVVAAAPTTSSTNSDTDGDGVADTLQTTGALQSYGNGSTLLIGSARDITINPGSADSHALVVNGTVYAGATYSNTDTSAIEIGGQGAAVNLVGGIAVGGTVQATTNDAQSTAILIHAGSSVPVIDNSGSIIASISSPGEGATYAIRDLSGTLSIINTSGFITASGSSDDTVAAIDLSANGSGVTITQTANATSTITSTITGNILTGAGNDRIIASAGIIKGNSVLAGGDDALTLTGTVAYTGNVDFGTGAATMSLADTAAFAGTAAFNNQLASLVMGGTSTFTGQISGGANLSVAVNGGTLTASGSNDLVFKSLSVGSGGTLQVAIDTTTRTNPKFVVDDATFASGSHIAASVSTLANAEGSYLIVTADRITGTPEFTSDGTTLPYLFKGTVSLDESARDLTLTIARKTADELGFNRVQGQAYAAILAAAPADTSIQSSLLGSTDQATLKSQFNALLPDHAGGNFDMLTRGARQMTRHLTDNSTMFDISNVGGWLEALRWTGNKDESGASGYSTTGLGVSGGLERRTAIGNIGLSVAWMNGKNEASDTANAVSINDYDFGVFWRTSSGPFYAFARAGLSLANFSSSRTYTGTASATEFTRAATADWKGKLYSGTAGISYQMDVGERISFKPMAIVNYDRLQENGYSEVDGGDAVNLVVADRTSDAATATTTVTGTYRFGPRTKEGIPLTVELEGGRRNMIAGALGDTVAHFTSGSDFTLTPDALRGAWLAEARLLSGGLDYTWTLSGSAEQTSGSPAYSVRFALGVAF